MRRAINKKKTAQVRTNLFETIGEARARKTASEPKPTLSDTTAPQQVKKGMPVQYRNGAVTVYNAKVLEFNNATKKVKVLTSDKDPAIAKKWCETVSFTQEQANATAKHGFTNGTPQAAHMGEHTFSRGAT